MGHEDLVRHLIRDAELRREEILGRARGEAVRLRASAIARAGELERESREALARDVARARASRENRARIEVRAMRFRARAALAAEILAGLEERLARLPGDAAYPGIVARLYEEIRAELPPGEAVLRGDAAALAALRSVATGPRFRFEPLPEGELGGVEVSSADGGFLVRNTLGSRLSKAMPELLAEIDRLLGAPDERPLLP
ncbi:MAG: V-type ATP synthase subunit E family protein [Gemmatimonadota bacterium]